MGTAIGIFYVIVMIVIFSTVNVAMRKGIKDGRNPAKTTKPVPRFRTPAVTGSSPRFSGRERSGKLVDSPVLLEDREHDWLAKQRREEARIMRRGDMTDLGASHSRACDARRIKAYHILRHDDSIDNGEA